MQLGYALGSWNTVALAYSKREGWYNDPVRILIVQSLTIAGVATGALLSGNFTKYGRWTCLIFANVVLIIGVLISVIDQYELLCLGRFIYGLGSGSFNVFGPLFITETAPIEIKGPLGALTELGISIGILIVFSVGIGIGDPDEDEVDSFQIQYYWYILFAIPLLISAVQLFLLFCIFKYDTPYFLKQTGNDKELTIIMNKIYKTEEIACERID